MTDLMQAPSVRALTPETQADVMLAYREYTQRIEQIVQNYAVQHGKTVEQAFDEGVIVGRQQYRQHTFLVAAFAIACTVILILALWLVAPLSSHFWP